MTEPVPEPTPTSFEPTPSTPSPDEPTPSEPGEPTTPGEPSEPTTETDEEEEGAEQEEVAQPPPEASLSQADWEKRFSTAEKRFSTYTNYITELWEEDAVHLIPVSLSPSAPPGFADLRDAGRIPEEIQRPVLEFFGLAREQDYVADPDTETCAACNGEGKTQTGSHVQEFRTRPCPRCKGWGYTLGGRSPSEQAAVSNGPTVQPLEEVRSLVTDERDNWGEPRILPDGRVNENYGKQPQFKRLIEPYGITANLTVQDAPV